MSDKRAPWTEAERLAALHGYNVLDTPTETEFDNITRVAALVCKTPMAVVNLVSDTRQFFKSEIGLGVREMPVEASICARVILEAEMLVIPDLSADSRFDRNPLVSGPPHLRFYAGARLDTPEGLPLGTVCVLDYQPRPEGLSTEQQEVLRTLARQAMAYLELKRAVEQGELLARELSHRIKNVFSVVSGLASASARDSQGKAGDNQARDFATSFRGRISALARAHDYVLPQGPFADSEGGNTVHGLLQTLLAPYDEGGSRIEITGDDLHLHASAATTLALILHEQATNAMKYGALSNDCGAIHVHCGLTDTDFTLSWVERGGPALAGVPEQAGFGARLVTSSINGLGGIIAAEWPPEGLRMTLSVPRQSLGG